GERAGYEVVRAYWSSPDAARGAGRVSASPPAAPAPSAARPAVAAAAAPTGANATSQFDRNWRQWLHDGLVPDTAFATNTVAIDANVDAQGAPRPALQGLEAVFRPDPTIYDGRFANNAWLQELPKSLTKLTWDNAALISPGTADRLRLISGDVVE